jgi:hypothetical protein
MLSTIKHGHLVKPLANAFPALDTGFALCDLLVVTLLFSIVVRSHGKHVTEPCLFAGCGLRIITGICSLIRLYAIKRGERLAVLWLGKFATLRRSAIAAGS